jgi:S-adenosylmethionine:diacylglycerol 3-amino-3-carboxypropyl transferase
VTVSDALMLLGVIVGVFTLGVVFFGAPYVPTRSRDLETLFDELKFKKSDRLVDLGSGDGRLMLFAARHGIKSVGVELNPILVIITWLRLRPVRNLASVRYANFWNYRLPSDTTYVFVFLAEPFMKRLRKYLESEAKRLGHPITLVSYGFELPGYKLQRKITAALVYEIKP